MKTTLVDKFINETTGHVSTDGKRKISVGERENGNVVINGQSLINGVWVDMHSVEVETPSIGYWYSISKAITTLLMTNPIEIVEIGKFMMEVENAMDLDRDIRREAEDIIGRPKPEIKPKVITSKGRAKAKFAENNENE